MRTSKLLMIGTALLVFVLAPTAQAEDTAGPDAAVAESGEIAPEDVAIDESAAPAPVESAEAAPVDEAMPTEGAPAADGAPVAEASLAEGVPAVDADPNAVTEAAAPELAEAAMPAPEVSEEASGIQLGNVGYDSEGRPGRIHVVSRGDTLWFISDAYLGTPWVWPSIWHDNRAIENPHLIYPGDHIWITPSEMRKVSPAEAEALLAGAPAEEELTEPAAQDLADVVIPGPAEAVVQAEQPKLRFSGREQVGLVSAETVDGAASILANTAPRLMISQEDRVYISLGVGEVVEGDEFTVFRVGSKVFDPETSRMLGYHVEFLGWVQVIDVDDEASLAIVRASSSEMFKGDKLIARLDPVSEIPLGNPPAGVEGQISYLPDSRTEMGMLDFVYLNRGTLDGVEVGSPLHVYRKGFSASDSVSGGKRQVPDRVVADLVVVRSEPEASVAFVRHTEEELTRGDHFRSPE